MHNFKKAFFATLAFLLCFVLMAGILFCALNYGDSKFYQDAKLRRSLAGSLDFIFCGASYGLYSFIPAEFDQSTSLTSYNLSTPLLPIHGRKVIIEKELSRNPIQTVALEISLDAMALAPNDLACSEGDAWFLPRLDTLSERIQYIHQYIPLDHIDYFLANSMLLGLGRVKDFLLGNSITQPAFGWVEYETRDVSLTGDTDAMHSSSMVAEANADTLQEIREIIQLCKQRDVEIILVVTPISDGILWQQDGEDLVYGTLKELCDEEGAQVLNFNLYKQRFSLFSDESSFGDTHHVGKAGAQAFTEIFADVIYQIHEGNDVSGLFYESYAQMEQHSPYNK